MTRTNNPGVSGFSYLFGSLGIGLIVLVLVGLVIGLAKC